MLWGTFKYLSLTTIQLQPDKSLNMKSDYTGQRHLHFNAIRNAETSHCASISVSHIAPIWRNIARWTRQAMITSVRDNDINNRHNWTIKKNRSSSSLQSLRPIWTWLISRFYEGRRLRRWARKHCSLSMPIAAQFITARTDQAEIFSYCNQRTVENPLLTRIQCKIHCNHVRLGLHPIPDCSSEPGQC